MAERALRHFKVEGLSATVKDQQKRIEDLTARIICLETALEIAMTAQGLKKSIDKKNIVLWRIYHN